MKLDDYFHLTYCSNIHPGESWPEVSQALSHALPAIRERLHARGPMAIGLRLSASAAETLEHDESFAAFHAFLESGDYYVPTINGFPYGAFHRERVKERVYLPDWRDPERLAYTNRLAALLARLQGSHGGAEPSVSTVPGAFRSAMRSRSDLVLIADALLRHAAFLVGLRERTGVPVTLGLEPEPACLIETVDDAVTFFTTYLFDERNVSAVAAQTGVAFSAEDVRRHIGICFDACHMAVEFEDPADAIRRLVAAGIRIVKVQLSSALRVGAETPGAVAVEALRPFAEDTYLHQVVQRGPRGLLRYADLPEALSATPQAGTEWRVHFHVPIFLPEMAGFQTTQPYLASVLEVFRDTRACPLLEVETYTWTVLPAEYREDDMRVAIARELEWVRRTLRA